MHRQLILAVVGAALSAVAPAEASDDHETPSTRMSSSTSLPTKWISEIMGEAEMAFDMDPNVSQRCREAIETYKVHAENQTVWAVRMMESSEWPTLGIFSGNTFHLGNYAECLRSRGPDIKGQYCLVRAKYNFTYDAVEQPAPGWIDWPAENETVWKILKMYEKSRIRVDRRILTWAICIPSLCTAEDLQLSMANTLRPIFKAYNLDVSVAVDPLMCQVKEAPQYSPGYYKARSFFIILLSVVILATGYDFYAAKMLKCKTCVNTAENWLPIQIVRCFSVARSYERLTSYSTTDIHFLYFFKTVATVIVVLGHAILLYFAFPKFHTEHAEMELRPWRMEILMTNVVHIFFLVSGFLAAYKFDSTVVPGTEFGHSIRLTLFRWLRLIVPYCLVAVYFVYLSEHAGDGPMWIKTRAEETQYCFDNWWTTILLVNNIINPDRTCISTSWYISVDIHLSVIATVLFIIRRRDRKLGTKLMVLTFLFFIARTFFNIYVNEYDGFFLHFPKVYDNYREGMPSIWYSYASTSFRAGPYLIGAVTGLLTAKLKQLNYQFSRTQMIFIPLLLSVIGFGSQIYVFLFYMEGRSYCALENAIFGAFHGVLFVLPIASFICIYFVSGLGVFNSIVSSPIFVPLGRLTYCVYLVSYPLQGYHHMIQRKALIGFGMIDMYWWGVTDVVFSFAGAFILFIISEGPIDSLTKLLLNRRLFGVPKTKLGTEKIEPATAAPSTDKGKSD